MAIVVPNGPNQGETELLDKMIKRSEEDYYLKLFKNNVVPTLATVIGDLTEADFTNYVAKSLTRAGWNAAIKIAPVAPCINDEAASIYGTEQSWTCGVAGNTVYGYYITGATSGKLLWLERFGTARILTDGDILRITPKFQFRTQIPCA